VACCVALPTKVFCRLIVGSAMIMFCVELSQVYAWLNGCWISKAIRQCHRGPCTYVLPTVPTATHLQLNCSDWPTSSEVKYPDTGPRQQGHKKPLVSEPIHAGKNYSPGLRTHLSLELISQQKFHLYALVLDDPPHHMCTAITSAQEDMIEYHHACDLRLQSLQQAAR